MKPSYAILWAGNHDVHTGRLEPHADRLQLQGRNDQLSIPFADLEEAAIARGCGQRLRGLPVLALLLRGGTTLRIASLEGAGALHELAELVERRSFTFTA